ncbi:hypothetical protein Q1695_000943 [Nippostrongylus brasiliensis]|nr:hypothetical protein Q1695_000943 [Nippostrongylus brasiliensis]
MFLLLFLASVLSPTHSSAVGFCREIKNCSTCAKSYTYTLGFREHCRWCVTARQCVGPLSCPFGKAVVERDPFRCPKKNSDAKGKRYTDALGRSLFSIILSTADENPQCLLNVRPDISYVRRFSIVCDISDNTCRGLLAVSLEAKSIYIVFQDSETQKQLAAELINGLGAQFGAWDKFEDPEIGVISYFHKAFYRTFIDTGMKDHVVELVQKYPDFRIWTTGYSLGGSLASMAALYLAIKDLVDKKSIRLVTFGEPRTGNVAYARAVEKHIRFRYRVVKGDDFIASIPRSPDPSAIITGPLFYRQPLFYRYLVHYDNKMKKNDPFIVCGLSDDYGCRNTHRSFNMQDHSSYFNVDREQFVKGGCPRDMIF